MRSWEQRERAQSTLAKEVGYIKKPHGNRLRVALAFPNTYWVGMSNLGFQTVYRLFNAEDDVVCERFFLPPKQELAELSAAKTPLVTLESQTPVRDFDVFAFSVSFEWDYTNVVSMLRLAGLQPRASARHARDPLVVIGGAVKRPGKYAFDRPTTVLQAIMEAGGADQFGTLGKVSVIRLVNGQQRTQVLDLRPILQGKPTKPLYVHTGDIILVGESAF